MYLNEYIHTYIHTYIHITVFCYRTAWQPSVPAGCGFDKHQLRLPQNAEDVRRCSLHLSTSNVEAEIRLGFRGLGFRIIPSRSPKPNRIIKNHGPYIMFCFFFLLQTSDKQVDMSARMFVGSSASQVFLLVVTTCWLLLMI